MVDREVIDPLKAIEMEAWELVLMEYYDELKGTNYAETIREYCCEYNALLGYMEKGNGKRDNHE